MDKGYFHVYTGNGKGKTTCALGLTLRACGAGKKIYIGQFLKDEDYSEIYAIRKYLPNVTIEQYGNGNYVKKGDGAEADRICAQKGCERALEVLSGKQYDMVILDEINIALFLQLIDETEVLKIIDCKPIETELVFTGRYANQKLIEKADLVTDMTEVKHYFKQGVTARKGIEK